MLHLRGHSKQAIGAEPEIVGREIAYWRINQEHVQWRHSMKIQKSAARCNCGLHAFQESVRGTYLFDDTFISHSYSSRILAPDVT
jgi:hypothetical protein